MSSVFFYSTRMRKKFSEIFFEFFLKSLVSRTVPKNVKGDPLEFFEHPFCCKIEKIERGHPLETLKKLRKSLTKTK